MDYIVSAWSPSIADGGSFEDKFIIRPTSAATIDGTINVTRQRWDAGTGPAAPTKDSSYDHFGVNFSLQLGFKLEYVPVI